MILGGWHEIVGLSEAHLHTGLFALVSIIALERMESLILHNMCIEHEIVGCSSPYLPLCTGSIALERIDASTKYQHQYQHTFSFFLSNYL
jgi:hypothetical protein